jgi:hypothetical protein
VGGRRRKGRPLLAEESRRLVVRRQRPHFRCEEKATAEERAVDRDPAKVLKNVSEQTGLTFKKEKRVVKILYATIPR